MAMMASGQFDAGAGPLSGLFNFGVLEKFTHAIAQEKVDPVMQALKELGLKVDANRDATQAVQNEVQTLRAELESERGRREAGDLELRTNLESQAAHTRSAQETAEQALRQLQPLAQEVQQCQVELKDKAGAAEIQMLQDSILQSEKRSQQLLQGYKQELETLERDLRLKFSTDDATKLQEDLVTRLDTQSKQIREEIRESMQHTMVLMEGQLENLRYQSEKIAKTVTTVDEQTQELSGRVTSGEQATKKLADKLVQAQEDVADLTKKLAESRALIDQVSHSMLKDRQKHETQNKLDGVLADIEKLKGLSAAIDGLYENRQAMQNEIEQVRDLTSHAQRDFRQKTDVLCEADAERAKQTAWLTSQTRLVQDDQDQTRNEIESVKKALKAIDNTAMQQRDINFCKQETKRLAHEAKLLNDSLRAYYAFVRYYPDAVCRRWHGQRKGADVRLGKDHLDATSQSDTARHGFVPGGSGDHGFAMGDGPMEKDPAGHYFETEVTEIFTNVVGTKGGLLVGYSQTPPDAVVSHVTGMVLDGVLIGGTGQVVVCKRNDGRAQETLLPPMAGAQRWAQAGELMPGQKVGVLLTGGTVAVFVDGRCVFADHSPLEVREDERVYPLVRISGSAKTVRLNPGAPPPRDAGQQVLQLRGK